MKKLLLSIIALALMFQTNAQENAVTKSLQIGAKAGVNLSTLTGDISGIKGRTSFHLGGVAEFPISEKLSIQPELLFSSQGAKYSDEANHIQNANTITDKNGKYLGCVESSQNISEIQSLDGQKRLLD